MILTIPTNFQKSLNKEFKPGRRVSHEELIIATEVERNIADAAVIPCDLVDFIEKVAFCLFIYFNFTEFHSALASETIESW